MSRALGRMEDIEDNALWNVEVPDHLVDYARTDAFTDRVDLRLCRRVLDDKQLKRVAGSVGGAPFACAKSSFSRRDRSRSSGALFRHRFLCGSVLPSGRCEFLIGITDRRPGAAVTGKPTDFTRIGPMLPFDLPTEEHSVRRTGRGAPLASGLASTIGCAGIDHATLKSLA